jgi:hypothetical protein
MAFVRPATLTTWVCLSLGVATANAALVDRSGGLIYDSDRNITWLQDANYAQTSGASLTGQMNWQTAVDWAANLSYGGYDDWRLPSTALSDANCTPLTNTPPEFSFGVGCTNSELGHMYYTELGGTVHNPLGPHAAPGPGPFTNIQADGYWSGSDFDSGNAYVVNFGFSGAQAADGKSIGYYAWAVRDGDVAVPAPGAAWLFSAGLLALAGRLRRRR